MDLFCYRRNLDKKVFLTYIALSLLILSKTSEDLLTNDRYRDHSVLISGGNHGFDPCVL